RDALIQGEAAINHGGLFNAQGIADSVTFLGVHANENLWPDLTADAPTIADSLGIDLPESVARYAFFVTAQCFEENPEEYQILADALEEAANSDGYQEAIEADGVASQFDWISGHDFFAEYIEDSEGKYGEIVDAIMTVLE